MPPPSVASPGNASESTATLSLTGDDEQLLTVEEAASLLRVPRLSERGYGKGAAPATGSAPVRPGSRGPCSGPSETRR